MGYVIVTDSVLDIEEDFLFQNGICTVPHSFMLEDYDTVEDDFGKTIPFSEIYRQMREGKRLPRFNRLLRPLPACLKAF